MLCYWLTYCIYWYVITLRDGKLQTTNYKLQIFVKSVLGTISLGGWRIVELLFVSFALLKVLDCPELKCQTASVQFVCLFVCLWVNSGSEIPALAATLKFTWCLGGKELLEFRSCISWQLESCCIDNVRNVCCYFLFTHQILVWRHWSSVVRGIWMWKDKFTRNSTSITKNFCVLHIQPNTTIFHPAVQ